MAGRLGRGGAVIRICVEGFGGVLTRGHDGSTEVLLAGHLALYCMIWTKRTSFLTWQGLWYAGSYAACTVVRDKSDSIRHCNI